MSKRASPRYVNIKDDILEKISDGSLPSGAQLETEQQIADRYRVSRPTVRHALTVLENDGYIERVQGKGTFVTSPSRNSRVESPSRTVGFVVPRLADIFVGRIMTGAQETLSDDGYHVSVFITNDSQDKERRFIEDLIDQGVAGVIIHPTTAEYYNPAMYALASRNVPFVMTGRHYRYLDCSYVEGDNYSGAYEAVEYLVGIGHRNIGLVTKPIMIKSSGEDRISGYSDALADHDIPIHRKLVLADLADSRSVYWDSRTPEEVERVNRQLRAYLEHSPEMTAVIALNDMIATDLLRIIGELGRVPGRDISVIGFDNVGVSDHVRPTLTTVEQPIVDLGREAARIVLEQIRNPNLAHQKLRLPTRLVVRESCSPCPI